MNDSDERPDSLEWIEALGKTTHFVQKATARQSEYFSQRWSSHGQPRKTDKKRGS